jgi:hypothetical protein
LSYALVINEGRSRMGSSEFVKGIILIGRYSPSFIS